jgi:hypothetical protein
MVCLTVALAIDVCLTVASPYVQTLPPHSDSKCVKMGVNLDGIPRSLSKSANFESLFEASFVFILFRCENNHKTIIVIMFMIMIMITLIRTFCFFDVLFYF